MSFSAIQPPPDLPRGEGPAQRVDKAADGVLQPTAVHLGEVLVEPAAPAALRRRRSARDAHRPAPRTSSWAPARPAPSLDRWPASAPPPSRRPRSAAAHPARRRSTRLPSRPAPSAGSPPRPAHPRDASAAPGPGSAATPAAYIRSRPTRSSSRAKAADVAALLVAGRLEQLGHRRRRRRSGRSPGRRRSAGRPRPSRRRRCPCARGSRRPSGGRAWLDTFPAGKDARPGSRAQRLVAGLLAAARGRPAGAASPGSARSAVLALLDAGSGWTGRRSRIEVSRSSSSGSGPGLRSRTSASVDDQRRAAPARTDKARPLQRARSSCASASFSARMAASTSRARGAGRRAFSRDGRGHRARRARRAGSAVGRPASSGAVATGAGASPSGTSMSNMRRRFVSCRSPRPCLGRPARQDPLRAVSRPRATSPRGRCARRHAARASVAHDIHDRARGARPRRGRRSAAPAARSRGSSRGSRSRRPSTGSAPTAPPRGSSRPGARPRARRRPCGRPRSMARCSSLLGS